MKIHKQYKEKQTQSFPFFPFSYTSNHKAFKSVCILLGQKYSTIIFVFP